MSADVPHTLYLKDNSSSSDDDSAVQSEAARLNMQSIEDMKRELEESRKKEEPQWEKVTPEQIFNEQ